MQLTKETFLNLTPPETKIKRTPIDGYSGLYCEQNKSGFTFQYSFKSPITGKYRFMKLARFKYGDNINKKMLDNVTRQLVINQGEVIKGIDPLEQKKAKTATPTTGGKTLNKVFDTYIETHYFKQLAPSTQGLYIRFYNNHISCHWGKIPVTNIRRPDVVVFLNGIESNTIYNGVKSILQAIQGQALDLGIIESPFLHGIKRRQKGSSSLKLSDDEIITLMTSTCGWDSLRNINKVQLLYGCRNGEVAGMRWEEIDMTAKTWTIPPERIKTEKAYKKMDRPHVLPLLPKLSEILLQQRQHANKGLVFPVKNHFSQTKNTHYKPSCCGRWLKQQLNISGGTHQLRRSVATNVADMKNISEFDIKIMLNHAVSGNTKAYINTQYLDRKIELFTKWHKYIDDLIEKGSLTKKVV